ncbi:MAG: alpha/beta fold hydrolase [Solirubrobacterales bacterium]
MSLDFMERPSDGPATGALFLHHGRGSWEGDLLPLADLFDPERRLHVFAPRAPLQIEKQPGFHWYAVPRVGYPDPTTFANARAELAAFHDDHLERIAVSPDRAVLGGFSMGAVVSYALAFGADRPRPAGVLAMSGFIPVLDDNSWQPELEARSEMPVFIGHGTHDMVIDFGFAEIARSKLEKAGFTPEFFEFAGGHEIPAEEIAPVAQWLETTLP